MEKSMSNETTSRPSERSSALKQSVGSRVPKFLGYTAIVALGAAVGVFGLPSSLHSILHENSVMAQSKKPVVITHFFTGTDKQSHSEEQELDLGTKLPLQPLSGVVEVHRGALGSVVDWHPAPQRQYVITLSGHGEIEFAGGQKVPMLPGHVEFIEDTTGKGHITRSLGTEDRISLWLPFVDQTVLPVNRNK
jgi:hypothetical protein